MPLFRFGGRTALAAVALGAALAAGLPRAATAQKYQIQASGVITSLSGSTQNLDGSIKIGTPYTYTFLFNTLATDVEASDPLNGQYELPGDFYGATVTVGDYTLTHLPVPIDNGFSAALFVGADPTLSSSTTYGNNYIEPYTDGALVTSTNPAAIQPYQGFTALILLSKPPNGLTSDAQPGLSAYSISRFRTNITPGPFGLVFNYDPTNLNNNVVDIGGSITVLRATAVPEPSSVAAFAFTALGVAGLRLRARKRKDRGYETPGTEN